MENSGDIFLQLANVGVWKVELLVIDYGYQKKAYFEARSWGSFARANSLTVGDECGFELVDGGAEPRFNVVVFRTLPVANTSSPRRLGKGPTTPSPATESGFACRPSKHSHSPKTRDKPHLTSPQPHKLRRRNGMERTASASALPGQNQSKAPLRETPLILAKQSGALARAKAAVFDSGKPSFMKVMKPSYIGPKTRLFAPADFFEANFEGHRGDIVLQVTGVGAWTIEYLVRCFGDSKMAVFQTKSWTSFAEDNSLKVGDVCVFELVECDTGKPGRLNVAIFRASQGANLCHRSGTGPTTKANSTSPRTKSGRHEPCHENTGNQRKKSSSRAALEAANGFTSNQPFFKAVVTPSNLTRERVYIPAAFWKHMKEGTCKMELCVGSESWGVRIYRYKADKKRAERMMMQGGWRAFAEGNSLEAGDVCVYELIKGEKDDATVVSVRVFRG